jgi:hypothetical protein
MIAHVVLFRTRSNLSVSEQRQLATSFEQVLRAVPSIRRAHVGRRVTHGRGYEQMMRDHYEYAAIIEFDTIADLQAYLEHPAHQALAARFFNSLEAALMYDFEMNESGEGLLREGRDRPSLT